MRAEIRDMTKADMVRVGEILYEAFNLAASSHGYAPKMQNVQGGRSWAWAMLHHAPAERLVAELDQRVVGVCCFNPRGDVGGVGPVAVDPAFQGHAIGRELMLNLVKRAESSQSLRLVQEAFNPASFSLYHSLNFVPVTNLLDLFFDGKAEGKAQRCSKISELTARDLGAVYAYDSPRSKMDRRADLSYYTNWGKVFVFRHQGQIRGFLACLPGSESVQLGPLLAEGQEEASWLFSHALAVFKDRCCRSRVMVRDYSLIKTLRALGSKLYCIDLLMVRGVWRPAHYVEAFGSFPEAV